MKRLLLVLPLIGVASLFGEPPNPLQRKQQEIELGEKLFHDPILSANGKVSCVTCHEADKGFTAGKLPLGLDGKPLDRDAPTLFNIGERKFFFWDGRAKTLEDQALGPLLHPNEMGNKRIEDVLIRVDKKYGIETAEELCSALAAYERTITRDKGRFGKYLVGDRGRTLTPTEERGWNLFRRQANCYKCHPSPILTDDDFHNTGISMDKNEMVDVGRAHITKKELDIGKFKTPPLWGCKETAPYMHDGSLKTLEEVVEFYDKGGVRNKYLDKEMFPLRLTPQQKRDLVAFLKAL